MIENTNWEEAHQLAIYKTWSSLIRNHQSQIHLVAERKICNRPAPDYTFSALATLQNNNWDCAHIGIGTLTLIWKRSDTDDAT